MSVHDFTGTLTTRVIANRAISVEVPNGNFSIRPLGSTMPMNVDVIKPGETGVTQIVLYPELGEDGLVAFCVRINRGQGAEYVPVFYHVVWKEKEGIKYPFIHVDESWVSTERIGRATASSIEVMVKGKCFSSRENADTIFVPDGNLLCRYMWGSASALDVLHAAVQKKVEPITDKRVEQLRREVRIATQELSRSVELVTQLQDDLSYHIRRSGEYVRQTDDLMAINSQLYKAISPIYELFGRLPVWMQPKSLRSIIGALRSANSRK